MRVRLALLIACLVAIFAGSTISSAQQPAQPPAADTVAPGIPGVVAAGTKVQVIKEGFNGTEGPIALPDGSLAFTETVASRITRIDAQNNVTTFLENTNGSNGLAWDTKGRLYSVQTVPGNTKIGIIYPPSASRTLAEGFPGRPNDLVIDRKTGIYFTVPGPSVAPGTQPPPGPFATAVYYIPPGKPAVKVAEGLENPNGLTLSHNEKTLYINLTQGEYIVAFDVQPDGTLANKRNFGKFEGATKNPQTGNMASGADGLAIDSEGRLYAATTAGVQVFSDKGQHLGTIPVSRSPQNLAFAGRDKRTLYIVGRGAAWKVQMLAQGYKGRAK